MLFKPLYRPSVKSASLIMRLCVVVTLAAGAAWYFIPSWREMPWVGDGLLAVTLLSAVMGAWHDGHAIGEKKGRESGSAIFLILIAIVLLAALTAAINQSSRTSTGMVSDQQAKLAAMEIIQYGNDVRQAVQKLLLRGCSENDLDFGNTNWKQGNGTLNHLPDHNENAPATGCSVFSPADGGIQAKVMPLHYTSGVQIMANNTMLGHSRVFRAAFPGVGESGKEEIAIQLPRLNEAICLKINELLGVSNPGGEPPDYAQLSIANYNGAFTDAGSLTDPSGVLRGKAAFCTVQINNDFWQVLHVR